MTGTTPLKRAAFALVALTLLAALPAFAGTAPVPQPAASGCQPSVSFLPDLAQPSPATASTLPAWLGSAGLGPQAATSSTVFHGFCRCSCSRIPNCNTSADCGGSACLGGITCC